jgi:hypothetical protein
MKTFKLNPNFTLKDDQYGQIAHNGKLNTARFKRHIKVQSFIVDNLDKPMSDTFLTNNLIGIDMQVYPNQKMSGHNIFASHCKAHWLKIGLMTEV